MCDWATVRRPRPSGTHNSVLKWSLPNTQMSVIGYCQFYVTSIRLSNVAASLWATDECCRPISVLPVRMVHCEAYKGICYLPECFYKTPYSINENVRRLYRKTLVNLTVIKRLFHCSNAVDDIRNKWENVSWQTVTRSMLRCVSQSRVVSNYHSISPLNLTTLTYFKGRKPQRRSGPGHPPLPRPTGLESGL